MGKTNKKLTIKKNRNRKNEGNYAKTYDTVCNTV